MNPLEDSEREYWEQIYRDQPADTLPWYSADLDPDFERGLQVAGIRSGRLLDIGTGPGTQAIALARLGYRVTATDISAIAVEQARERAQAEGWAIEFRQDDILGTRLEGPFDAVLDRGVFQNIPPDRRADYVRVLGGLLDPAGALLLKCFSRKEQAGTKPYRFSPGEIEGYFQAHFVVLSVTETVFRTTNRPPPQALFFVMRRRSATHGHRTE